jgi:hypothetical protein
VGATLEVLAMRYPSAVHHEGGFPKTAEGRHVDVEGQESRPPSGL